MQYKVGDTITVKEHTSYKHLVGNTVVNPARAYSVPEYQSTIIAIYVDDMEDFDGNVVKEYTIETGRGEHISLLEDSHLIVKVS